MTPTGKRRVGVSGMKAVIVRTAEERDREQIMLIFNHYVATGFAAYPDRPVPLAFFDRFRHEACAFYVAEQGGDVVGFSLLKPFLPFSTFAGTAVVSTFVDPSHRHVGLGSILLDAVTQAAAQNGITNLLANVSSKNSESMAFHKHHGFTECGRFHKAGLKFNERFDVVWMEKELTCTPAAGRSGHQMPKT
jgi:L-amino acid N-acyltransferase YncA